MLNHLDLFSGIGGFSLGLERTGGFKTVAFCEIDPFCQKVLKKHWPHVPIHDDVRSLDYDGSVDIITGGYPCQPFSTAGKRKGAEDDRHLWPAMFNIIKKYRPSWIIGENVAGHISMGLDNVLADLESENYQCRPFVIPACAVNAPHRRDRVWILASNTEHNRSTEQKCEHKRPQKSTRGDAHRLGSGESVANAECKGVLKRGQSGNAGKEGGELRGNERHGLSGSNEKEKKDLREALADTDSNRIQGSEVKRSNEKNRTQLGNEQLGGLRGLKRGRNRGEAQWLTESDVGRVAHGIPRRVDRLKSLGNAVVPQIPEIIGNAILEAEK